MGKIAKYIEPHTAYKKSENNLEKSTLTTTKPKTPASKNFPGQQPFAQMIDKIPFHIIKCELCLKKPHNDCINMIDLKLFTPNLTKYQTSIETDHLWNFPIFCLCLYFISEVIFMLFHCQRGHTHDAFLPKTNLNIDFISSFFPLSVFPIFTCVASNFCLFILSSIIFAKAQK